MGLPSVLPGHYNATLVTISITIAILTAAASLCVAGRIAAATGWLQFAWLVTAGITMGLGIACMHYLGMAAMIETDHAGLELIRFIREEPNWQATRIAPGGPKTRSQLRSSGLIRPASRPGRAWVPGRFYDAKIAVCSFASAGPTRGRQGSKNR
jgi:hypothetical protein